MMLFNISLQAKTFPNFIRSGLVTGTYPATQTYYLYTNIELPEDAKIDSFGERLRPSVQEEVLPKWFRICLFIDLRFIAGSMKAGFCDSHLGPKVYL